MWVTNFVRCIGYCRAVCSFTAFLWIASVMKLGTLVKFKREEENGKNVSPRLLGIVVG